MRKHFYRQEQNQIIFHDTLEIIDMNKTASFIYESTKKFSKVETIYKYSKEFNIDDSQATEEVSDLINQLAELGIVEDSQKQEDPSFIPHTPIVHIIQNCNSPCVMCDCWKTRKKTYHSAKELKPFHLKMKEFGAKGIMISGGEPLLHPELKTILSDLKHMGLPIFLNTNAILLHKHMDWLTNLNIEELVISMDGSDKETYKLIRGAQKFDQVWSNIKEFRAKNPNTRIILRTTLTKYNAFNLNQLIDMALEYGIDHIGFSPLDSSSESFSRDTMVTDRSNNLKDLLLPTYDQINDFIKIFEPGNRYYESLVEHEKSGLLSWGPKKIINCLDFYKSILINQEKKFSADPCLFPIFSLIVDYDGSLKNCFYSKPFGNLNNLSEVNWDFKVQMEEIKKSKKCEDCRGKVFCDLGLLQEVNNV